MSPHEPLQTGFFFAYPGRATGTVADYWMTSDGPARCKRMTDACVKAVCATLEAAIERAVFPCMTTGDISSRLDELKPLSYYPPDPDDPPAHLSLVSLGPYADANVRAGIKDQFVRSDPYFLWRSLVPLVIDLWRLDRDTEITDGLTVLGYCDAPVDWDSYGFISADDAEAFFAGLNSIANLRSYSASFSGLKPWGEYEGADYSSPVHATVAEICGNIGYEGSVGGSWSRSFTEEAPQHIADRLFGNDYGNWFGTDGGGHVFVTPRRPSVAWEILQAMLCMMRYVSFGFDYLAEFETQVQSRIVVRMLQFTVGAGGLSVTAEDVSDTGVETRDGTSSFIVAERSMLWTGVVLRGTVYISLDPEGPHTINRFFLASFPDDGEYNPGEEVLQFLGIVEQRVGTYTYSTSATNTTGGGDVAATIEDTYPCKALNGFINRYGATFFARREDGIYNYTPEGTARRTPDEPKISVRSAFVGGDEDWKDVFDEYMDWLKANGKFVTVSPFDVPEIDQGSINGQWNEMVERSFRLYYDPDATVEFDGQTYYRPTHIAFGPGMAGHFDYDQNDEVWKARFDMRVPITIGVFGDAVGDKYELSRIFMGGDRALPGKGLAVGSVDWKFAAMPNEAEKTEN